MWENNERSNGRDIANLFSAPRRPYELADLYVTHSLLTMIGYLCQGKIGNRELMKPATRIPWKDSFAEDG